MENKLIKQPVKYDLKDLVGVVILFVVVGLVLVFASQINTDVGAGYAAGTAAKNATIDVQTSFGTISTKLPTLAVVIVAAVIIGVLLRSFGQFAQ